jgi:hypothetical protein
MTDDYAAATALAEGRDAWRASLILAALDNIIRYDTDPVLKAACRARSLELTDGGHANDNG